LDIEFVFYYLEFIDQESYLTKILTIKNSLFHFKMKSQFREITN